VPSYLHPLKGAAVEPSQVRFWFHSATSEPITVDYDRTKLKLGSLVHVKRDSEGNIESFSPTSKKGSEAYGVTWISPSEWAVLLEREFRGLDILRDQTTKALAGVVEAGVVAEAIEKAAKNRRLQYLYKTSEFEKSKLDTITAATERLNLVRILQQRGVAKELWKHWQALCVYLLLTCFDLLGQSDEWMDFGAWLNARKVAIDKERKIALAKAARQTGLISQSKVLYREYGKRYGVRRSFNRFIDELLPLEWKGRLLDSMHMTRLALPPDLTSRPASEEEKKRYLFELRNNYTHNARFRPVAGVQVSAFFPEDSVPEGSRVLTAFDQRVEADHWLDVSTEDWPNTLFEVVRQGFANYLRKIASGPDPGPAGMATGP